MHNIEITTKVVKVVWYNPQNKWGVLNIENNLRDKSVFNKPTIIVTGNFENLYEDCNVLIKGDITEHPKYGVQIALTSYKILIEKDNKESIINFLTKSAIRGISLQNSIKIYKAFGKNSIETVLHEPEKLLNISGIGEKTVLKVKESVKTYLKMESLINYCTELGFSYQLIFKIHKELGNNALKVLEENIYSILDYTDNISFKQIDSIALLNGGAPDDENRQKYCFLYLLKLHVIFAGSTGIKAQEFKNLFLKELGCSESNTFNYICNILLEENKIYLENNRVYYKEFYDLEKEISVKIKQILTEKCSLNFDKEIIKEEIKNFPYSLNKQQVQAVINTLKNKVSIITGLPGSGKTSISKALVNIFTRHLYNVVLLSPTGKAARRLEECVKLPAQTIHKFLGIKKSEDLKNNNSVVRVPRKTIILVDEVSMVDIKLFNKLLESFNVDTRLILVGDSNQLPSVSAGNVLNDLIQSNKIYTSNLTDIMRQSESSSIIKVCCDINDGQIVPEQDKNDFMYMSFSSNKSLLNTLQGIYELEINKNSLQEVQILTCYKKNDIGSNSLNKVLSEKYNKNTIDEKFGFRIGDKVIHIRNNYELGVMNGETGVVSNIDEDYLYVNYGGIEIVYTAEIIDELDLAYAITTHKSQGSEYPVIIFVIDDYTSALLIRKIAYTAVSRGKNKVYVLGMNSSFESCILNNYEKQRITKLKSFLSV